jgi:hypothetical protein
MYFFGGPAPFGTEGITGIDGTLKFVCPRNSPPAATKPSSKANADLM